MECWKDPEEAARAQRREEVIDAATAQLSNYWWNYFITLTFRDSMGEEAIERAIRRFTRFLHENCFGAFAITDLRDLFGIRYCMAIERGSHGTKRLHAHLLICGGEKVGAARWTDWREWWNREYGGCRIEKPRSQGDVAAYCVKYMLKGQEFGFELRSTWADERDYRNRAEIPLYEPRKVGIEIVPSAELEKQSFRGSAPSGAERPRVESGRPCRHCGLVSLCRCFVGTSTSGQVYGPEPDPGAYAGESCEPSSKLSPAPQLAFFPMNASGSKTVLSSRRARRRARYHGYMSRSSNAVVCSPAASAIAR